MVISLQNDQSLLVRYYPMFMTCTIWLFNIAMENPPIFKNGKPSISIRAIEKPWQTVKYQMSKTLDST